MAYKTPFTKNDIVSLTISGEVETDRAVKRWYAAGTQFRVLGTTADGYVRCRDESMCRVIVSEEHLELVRAASAASATSDVAGQGGTTAVTEPTEAAA